jgi:hypothetical protein
MKKALVVAAGLMLVALPALSQSSTDSDDRSYDRRDRDDLEELLRGIGDDGPGRRLRRGAGFLLRSGDATVAVRCDPQENMRACVDATTTLLERARATLPPAGTPPTPPTPR